MLIKDDDAPPQGRGRDLVVYRDRSLTIRAPDPSGKASLDRTTEKTAFDRTIGRNSAAAITPVEYCGLQKAVDHFKAELFEDALPDVLITYQRRAHSAGYFSPDRFSGRADKPGAHELALNPDVFTGQSDEEICQTLVHEMAHAWQHAYGKPSAGGYHNREWARKMKEVGLQPSSTGEIGGKETGSRMMDCVIPDGPFVKAFAKLAATGWKMNLESAPRSGPKRGGGGPKNGGAGPEGGGSSKTKVTCPQCGQNAWGKPDLAISCTPCGTPMTPEAL
jgi:predicted SprT family Zn-dependent metalloprotease